jgi:nitrite reductase (NADH) large subunit
MTNRMLCKSLREMRSIMESACVIIGGGVAGFQAAFVCRRRWPDKSVTIIDAEGEVGYYRSLLPQFMTGALGEDRLFFWREGQDPQLAVRSGTRVKSLDRKNRVVMLESGEAIPYERLVLAHGGDANMPELLAGIKAQGIFSVRDLASARKTRQWLSGHRKVIVFGGSLVAVKTAVHLRQAGYDAAVMVRRDHVLLRALTPRAAQAVEVHLRRMGIKLLLECEPDDCRVKGGAVSALRAGGKWHPCETILVAAGATPDTKFLEGTGLLKDGELIVSPSMQTCDERIFSSGDAATVRLNEGVMVSPRTWPEAVAQGKLAAENLYRSALLSRHYFGRVNAMELHGLPLVVLGPPVPGAVVISFEDRDKGAYRELFLMDGRIVGGALIGDISGAGILHARMASAEQVNEDELIYPRSQAVRMAWTRKA